MALKTTTELLEEVETAISNTLASQEYRSALGSGKKLPQLETLFQMQKYYRGKLDQESGDSGRVFRGNFNV